MRGVSQTVRAEIASMKRRLRVGRATAADRGGSGLRAPTSQALRAQRIRLATTLLLGLAIAVQLYSTVIRIAGVFKSQHTSHHAALSARTTRHAPDEETLSRRIVAAHLFGASPARSMAARAAPAELKLDLTLVGTLAESDPEKGFAIIKLGSQKTELFAAHAQIGVARLLRIFTDHVVVDWQGGERVLTLPRLEHALPLLASNAVDDASEPAGPTRSVQGTGEVPMRMANYRQILDEIDYHPRIVGNAIEGIKISGVKDEDKLAKVGLQAGDIVTSMDGVPITDARRIDDLLKALSDGQPVTATIIRNGETTSEVLRAD